jgi:uncharacterized coiled-coil DUF342 family protein
MEIKEEVETKMNEIQEEAELYKQERDAHNTRKKELAEKIKSLKHK